eukprot:225869-Rhodomonas_salina.1
MLNLGSGQLEEGARRLCSSPGGRKLQTTTTSRERTLSVLSYLPGAGDWSRACCTAAMCVLGGTVSTARPSSSEAPPASRRAWAQAA